MKATYVLFALILLGVFIPVVSAQEPTLISAETTFDSAMLVTEDNYADALIAASASLSEGEPVLLTDGKSLSDDTITAIEDNGIEEITIVGGPLAIDDKVEQALINRGIKITRIWGATRYGTAAELARRKWVEGSVDAVIAPDTIGRANGNNYGNVNLGKSFAVSKRIPLLLTDKDNLSSEVVEAIGDLGIQKVWVIGPVSDGVKTELQSLGVEVVNMTAAQIRAEIQANASFEGKYPTLVVIAHKEFQDVLKHPVDIAQHAVVVDITSEDEIQNVLDVAAETTYDRMIVVGNPELATAVRDALRDEGYDPLLRTGRALGLVNQFVQENKGALLQFKEKHQERIGQLEPQLMERSLRYEENTRAMLDRGIQFVEDNEIELTDAQKARIDKGYELLDNAAAEIDAGNYYNAVKETAKVRAAVRMAVWNLKTPSQKQQEINEETAPAFGNVAKQRIMDNLDTAVEHIEARIADLNEQGISDTSTLQKLTQAEEKLSTLKTSMESEDYKVAYGQLVAINARLKDVRTFRLQNLTQFTNAERTWVKARIEAVKTLRERIAERITEIKQNRFEIAKQLRTSEESSETTETETEDTTETETEDTTAGAQTQTQAGQTIS